jgi:hypothetical protein
MSIKLLLLLSFIPLVSFSEKRVLNGYLGIEGGEVFSYKIEFSEIGGNRITGNATTWTVAGKDVCAKIEGVVDKKNYTLSFYEKEIVYNTGFTSKKTICLINAKLKFSRDENNVFVLSGKITSNDLTNITCAKGSITFGNINEIRPVFEEEKLVKKKPIKFFENKNEPKKQMRFVNDVTDNNQQDKSTLYNNNKKEMVTSGMNKIYDWSSDSVTVEIWDNSMVDGDVISVSYNGRRILENYTIVNEKKILRLPVDKEVNELTITAVNEGSQQPNTTDILLHDGKQAHSLIAYNSIGKQAVIRIRKQVK